MKQSQQEMKYALAELPRVVVCGTGFGLYWIEALCGCEAVEVVGVLTRGSDRSRRIAADYQLPLFVAIDAIPKPVDAAVVAVGEAAGEQLALEWLNRGVPVLLEHPVRPKFLKKIHTGKHPRPHLYVNGHFSDLPQVREYIRLCVESIERINDYVVSFTCTMRSLYSTLDIIVELLSDRERNELIVRFPWGLQHNGGLRLGRMKLIPSIVPEVGADDTAAANIGGHLIQCWLPAQRIILAGPTGPIITLNADSVSPHSWFVNYLEDSKDWRTFSKITRPLALFEAMHRLLTQASKTEVASRANRDLLVALLCRNIIDECPF